MNKRIKWKKYWRNKVFNRWKKLNENGSMKEIMKPNRGLNKTTRLVTKERKKERKKERQKEI